MHLWRLQLYDSPQVEEPTGRPASPSRPVPSSRTVCGNRSISSICAVQCGGHQLHGAEHLTVAHLTDLWLSGPEVFHLLLNHLTQNAYSVATHYVWLVATILDSLGLDHVFSPVQFSRSVVSDSLQPQESWHARPPCPSPTPGVHPDPRPSSQ